MAGLEFSPLGLVLSIAVLVPNFLLFVFPPHGARPAVEVPLLTVWLERLGQALCLVVPVITASSLIAWAWVALVLPALVVYYALWGRYLVGGRRWSLLYSSLGVVPVPMAVFPVVVFLGAAGWFGNAWLTLAGVILAAGHIPASIITAKSIFPTKRGGPV